MRVFDESHKCPPSRTENPDIRVIYVVGLDLFWVRNINVGVTKADSSDAAVGTDETAAVASSAPAIGATPLGQCPDASHLACQGGPAAQPYGKKSAIPRSDTRDVAQERAISRFAINAGICHFACSGVWKDLVAPSHVRSQHRPPHPSPTPSPPSPPASSPPPPRCLPSPPGSLAPPAPYRSRDCRSPTTSKPSTRGAASGFAG